MNAAMGSRVQVIGGEAPLSPVRDTRVSGAFAGLFLGGFLPVAALLGLGMARRRYNWPDQVQEDPSLAPIPLLGVIPQIAREADSFDADADAVLALHRARSALSHVTSQHASTDSCRVYLLASAERGDGKTTIAAALGRSLAAVGTKVLLIDADRSNELTRQVCARKFDPASSSSGTESRSGEKLWVRTVQKHTTSPCDPVLSVQEIEELRRAAAAAGIAVILIDADTVSRCADATLLATLADAVILIIRRGQQRAQVEQLLEMLRTIGARIGGLLFNCAVAPSRKEPGKTGEFLIESTRSEGRAALDTSHSFEPANICPTPSGAASYVAILTRWFRKR
jgi:Mrp family chromosome partitioning ATPase